LVGELTCQVFRISDKVRIKVARVDLDSRKIDFELLEQLTSQQVTLGRPASTSRREEKPAKKSKSARSSRHCEKAQPTKQSRKK